MSPKGENLFTIGHLIEIFSLLLCIREELALLRRMDWRLGHEAILAASYHLIFSLLIDLFLIVILIGLFHLFYADVKHLFHHV